MFLCGFAQQNQFAAYLAPRSIVATRNCTRNGAEFPQFVREGRRREEENKREVLSMYKTQTETERETHRQSERERERTQFSFRPDDSVEDQ